jgi:hypothetical protein
MKSVHRPERNPRFVAVDPFAGFTQAYREAIDPRTRPGRVITLDQMPEEKRQELLRLYGKG